MTVYDWEVDRILREVRERHTKADWQPFTDQLERLVKDYAGRRTIEAHMVRDIAELAYGHLAEQVATATASQDEQGAKLRGVIERLEERLDKERERNARWRKAVEEQRILREERQVAQDGLIDVRFENSRRHWTVADLEEIAYRLRLGGGSDDTVVEMSEWFAKAKVVDPTLVSLDLARNPEPMRLDPPEHDAKSPSVPWRALRVPALVGLVSGLLSSVAVVVLR